MTNKELAAAIYDCGRVLEHYTVLELLALVANWDSEELNQINPPDAIGRYLTEFDQIRIVAELATILAEEY